MNEIWGNFVNRIRAIYFSLKENKRYRYLIAIILFFLLIHVSLCSNHRSENNNENVKIPSHTEIAATIYAEIYLHTEIAATIYAQLTPAESSTPIPTDTLIPTITSFPTDTPTVYPTITPIPTSISAASSNCDPSYPDVCIPSPPPDLDCGDIPYRRFWVLPPDPHGFDRDNDGIGCES